jgi:hypothetical protein
VFLADRIDNQSYKIFFLWFTANFNILSCVNVPVVVDDKVR